MREIFTTSQVVYTPATAGVLRHNILRYHLTVDIMLPDVEQDLHTLLI